MSEEKKNLPNFKKLWNKQYGDLIGHKLAKNTETTPEQVMGLVVKYFEWAENNTIKAGETASFQGRVYQDTIDKPRVFTWTALLLFCSFSASVVAKWRKTPGYDVVMDFADQVIREQKYQLAANGMVNTGMIAKELGIDKGDTITVTASAEAEANTEEAMKQAVQSVLGKL